MSCDIKKGDVFFEENICLVRFGYGFYLCYYWDLIGKRVIKDLEIGDWLIE